MDFAVMSKSDLVAQLNRMQAEQDEQKALAGVVCQYAEGVNKAGKPWQNVGLTGSVFGFPGLKFTPAKWDRLMELVEYVSGVIDENRKRFK